MATSAVRTTTNAHAAVSRHAASLKQTIRGARSRATVKQADEYTRNVAKAVLSSERTRAVEQVVALVVDVAQRGSLEDAEAIGLHLAAIARAEHAAARPMEIRGVLSVPEAHALEEHAEGAVEEAETAMAHHPGSASHYLNYLTAAAAHTRARRQLDEAVRFEATKRSP